MDIVIKFGGVSMAARYFLPIEKCEVGMKTAETIYNEFGAVIVWEDSLLDENVLNKLRRLRIDRIKVFSEEDEVIPESKNEVFRAQYQNNVDMIKDILHDISVGKSVDLHKTEHISNSIFNKINENRDIVGAISSLRDVDDYTYCHSTNVSLLCMLIGKWMRLNMRTIKDLITAGLLHDVGKSKIPEEILHKPGKLTEEEYETMKKHAEFSYKILQEVEGLNPEICKAVLFHHEREDGSGYPFGIKSDKIPFMSKVIAVADMYDAMTANRVFKSKESPFKVFDILQNHSFGVLETSVVNHFLTNIASYYIGDSVRLSDGRTGEIIYINAKNIARPVVKSGETYVDLFFDKKLDIVELII